MMWKRKWSCLHEDAQTQKLAREMSKLSDTAAHTVEVEEDDMDATRTLDDLRSIKEIRPTAGAGCGGRAGGRRV